MSPLILRHNCLTKIQSHTESRETKNGTPTRIFRRSKFWQFYYDKKCYLTDFYGVFIQGLWTDILVFTKNKVFFRWPLCSVFITVSTYSLNVKFSSESEYRVVENFRPGALRHWSFQKLWKIQSVKFETCLEILPLWQFYLYVFGTFWQKRAWISNNNTSFFDNLLFWKTINNLKKGAR